jgi:hypothetical protein
MNEASAIKTPATLEPLVRGQSGECEGLALFHAVAGLPYNHFINRSGPAGRTGVTA